MAIRFPESDARPMGRDTSGVRGINLSKSDHLVGIVVADPDATLLTVCEKGYGKRTPFGAGTTLTDSEESTPSTEEGESESSGMRYRTQRRGGKGIRDIKTTDRNGQVVSVVAVKDDDQVLMMTARGKLQRVNVGEIKAIGRNTQGVRIMRLDKADTLAAVVPVPPGEQEEADAVAEEPVAGNE
jgi:DNA gyrase subunit A